MSRSPVWFPLQRHVDRPIRRRYVRRALGLGALTAYALAGSGCAPAGAPREPGTVDAALAEEAREATRPRHRVQVVFDWTMRDRDVRLSGQGVARIDPDGRARLDLFGPRGETYLAAALVGQDLRLPAAGLADVLPPPALLWSAIGVVEPVAEATLVEASRNGRTVTLGYALGRERWRYRLEDGRLVHVQWERPGEGRRTVELKGSAAFELPGEALYRDHIAFRELELKLKQADEVDAFPIDIWDPRPPP